MTAIMQAAIVCAIISVAYGPGALFSVQSRFQRDFYARCAIVCMLINGLMGIASYWHAL